MTEPIAGFDAVALQEHGAQRIFEETKDLTPEEEQAYWDRETEAVLAEQRALQRAAGPAAPVEPVPELP